MLKGPKLKCRVQKIIIGNYTLLILFRDFSWFAWYV